MDVSGFIGKALEGNSEALNTLMVHYRGYLPVKADPSDVAHEAPLADGRDFAGFRGESERELTGWLRRVLAHSIANLVRRHRGTSALPRLSRAAAALTRTTNSGPRRRFRPIQETRSS